MSGTFPLALPIKLATHQELTKRAASRGRDDSMHPLSPNLEFSSSSDGHTSSDDERKMTLDKIKPHKRITLSIRSTYAREWGPVEAFRELVQNWKILIEIRRDGIVKSFKLKESDFQVAVEDNEHEIVYKVKKAARMRSQECLGYIRWALKDGEGTVEITNRKATLQPWHLDMGGGTKSGSKDQAGVHGEGLKVALLVMMRNGQNHAVICRSGSFTWTFNFNADGKLTANLAPMRPELLKKLVADAKKTCKDTLLPVEADPSKDVQFLLEGGHVGRDQNGCAVTRDGISRGSFLSWTKAALFLQKIPDQHIVHTSKGDLLNPPFVGRIYLKGLLLQESEPGKSASISGRKLEYGYNFFEGQTNRERRSMARAGEESKAIMSIWNEGFKSTVHQDALVSKLHEMLVVDAWQQCADVQSIQDNIAFATVIRLKGYLLSEKFRGKWFHESDESTQDANFKETVQGFGCEPYRLSDVYWRVMRPHLRTASEEKSLRFGKAAKTSVPENDFSQSLDRLIRASLQSTQETTHTVVEFVAAGDLNLDLQYTASTQVLKIHERWLTAEGAKKQLDLSQEVRRGDLISRAAQRLVSTALRQIPLCRFDGEGEPGLLRDRAISRCEQRIADYVNVQTSLDVVITEGVYSDSMVITWDDKAGWVSSASVHVQVHLRPPLDMYLARHCCKHNYNSIDHMYCFASCRNSKHVWSESVTTFSSKSCSFQSLTRGQDYIVTMCNNDVPGSFIVFSERPRKRTFQYIPPPTPKNLFECGDAVPEADVTLAMMSSRNWFHASSTRGDKAVLGIENQKDQESAKRKHGLEDTESTPSSSPRRRRLKG